METTKHILDVRNMKKYFPITAGFLKRTVGYVKAVDDMSLTVAPGETVSLVGESGCGKTTFGRCVLQAIKPTAGETFFTQQNGEVVELSALPYDRLRVVRRDMQMIFQDPYASLNPRMTVLNIISEPLVCHGLMSGRKLREYVMQLMETVGLDPRHLERYPHAFSGGQRQRIGIARALATNPRFIVCDEAVSALDVSVQAQILNLLMDLQEKLNLSYLFISHDLGVVSHISDRVAVMYVGRLVELAPTKELFEQPLHPYTEALLSAKPVADPRNKCVRIVLEGDVANPANLPSGCPFHPRCIMAKDICKTDVPEWRELKPGHFVSCHRAHELELCGMGMMRDWRNQNMSSEVPFASGEVEPMTDAVNTADVDALGGMGATPDMNRTAYADAEAARSTSPAAHTAAETARNLDRVVEREVEALPREILDGVDVSELDAVPGASTADVPDEGAHKEGGTR